MFELPEAKRVRREELESADSSDGSEGADRALDAELRARLGAQIATSLGLHTTPRAGEGAQQESSRTEGASRGPGDQDAAQTHDDDDLGEFAFRLFHTAEATATVVLRPEDEARGPGGIVARRPAAHYLAARAPAARRREYEFAAVDGDDVLARSRAPAWGLEMPWKVTKIATTITHMARDSDTHTTRASASPPPATRRRPGKKRRIAMRKRERTRKEQVELMAKADREKEEHFKDKKKRLNRVKKLRKRAKDKEKKLAATDGAGPGDDGSDGAG
ncbi:hypothetical protein CDD83_1405 [Cordyceps sp. RAO-2017]|nr:hypothetical protein CDD83_1405 [Cordyceps sp. RAO-2017]